MKKKYKKPFCRNCKQVIKHFLELIHKLNSLIRFYLQNKKLEIRDIDLIYLILDKNNNNDYIFDFMLTSYDISEKINSIIQKEVARQSNLILNELISYDNFGNEVYTSTNNKIYFNLEALEKTHTNSVYGYDTYDISKDRFGPSIDYLFLKEFKTSIFKSRNNLLMYISKNTDINRLKNNLYIRLQKKYIAILNEKLLNIDF